MSYLQPPPDMSPVVVVKDYGGYVNEYAAQTESYRRSGREVRIHECHSACTMALSLPNVCVYRDSIFKFHQAYDPRNHVTNWAVTDELYRTYPDAVRERLGMPTKTFTIMRGTELIGLGVRDCAEPQGPRVIVASASARPLPETMGGSSGWSVLTGRLGGMVPNFGNKPEMAPADTPAKGPSVGPSTHAPAITAEMLAPLPPQKPADLQAQTKSDAVPESVPESVSPAGGIPLPPPRPNELQLGAVLVARAPGLLPVPISQRIAGSQPILPARFTPFPRKTT